MDATTGADPLKIDATDPRALKGALIAATQTLRRNGKLWGVPSQTHGGKLYWVDPEAGTCDCPDFGERPKVCKHQHAVVLTILREKDPESGRTIVTERLKVRPKKPFKDTRDPVICNLLAQEEEAAFMPLLRALCEQALPIPRKTGKDGKEERRGRPRLEIAEVIFAAIMMQYLKTPWKKLKKVLKRLHEKGYISRVPHPNSIARWVEDPRLLPILLELLRVSALPLCLPGKKDEFESGIETVVEVPLLEEDEHAGAFAIDGSGVTTTRYGAWYAKRLREFQKRQREEEAKAKAAKGEAEGPKVETKAADETTPANVVRGHRVFVKLHISVNVRSHVVMAAVVTRGSGKNSADTVQFEPLMRQTMELADMRRILADKAYLSYQNVEFAAANKAPLYAPPKTSSTGETGPDSWLELLERFYADPAAFDKIYHMRSNVEATFRMIYSSFGSQLSAQWWDGQQNETLLKCIGHNVRCVLLSLEKFPELHHLVPGFADALAVSKTRERKKRAPRRKREVAA
jgi:hypothetical protein